MIRTFLPSLIFFLIAGTTAHAASIGFGQPEISASMTSFALPLVMTTENFSINAVEGNIIVPDGVTDVYNASSIVAFWTVPPTIKDGTLTFSGIIPGGFQGTGVLFWLMYDTPTRENEMPAILSFTALRNDGLGTQDEISIKPTGVLMAGVAQRPSFTNDQTPPEPFSVAIVGIPDDTGKVNYAAIFATQDNETGIDRYEVQETSSKIASSEEWLVAESPYVFMDQERQTTLFVRAIDKAGNIREGTLSSGPEDRLVWPFFAILALILIMGVRWYRRKKTLN